MCHLFIIGSILVAYLSSPPDSDYVKLQRTRCYGTCPAYSVTVFAGGKVVYVGEHFVKVTGKRSYTVRKATVRRLFQSIQKMNFFSLASEFLKEKRVRTKPDGTIDTLLVDVTDSPTRYITVRIGNRLKTVKNYYGGPPELEELEVSIDKVAQTSKWVKGK